MKEYHKIQTIYKRNPETGMKTLLEREFSLPEFEYLANNLWIFTEKIDGTNIRIMFDGQSISFGGKTDRAQIPSYLVNALNDQFLPLLPDFKEIFESAKEVCFYGEGYGAKIQKGGGNYRQDQGFVLFDIKIGHWWLKRQNIEDIANRLNIECVPIIGQGALFDMVNMAKDGFNSCWGNFKAEGIVARPAIELMARNGQRMITKIKYKDFKRENNL